MSAYNGGSPCIFQTYPATSNTMPDCAIWGVLCATMTDPSLFKAIKVGESGLPDRFVAGSYDCSNPTSHLLDEAKRLFPGRQVGCIVSIGAGHAQTISIPSSSWLERALHIRSPVTGALKAAHRMATDSEKVAEEISKRFADTKDFYYRLNVNQGMQGMKTSEWERQEEVVAHTRSYLRQTEIDSTLNDVVAAMRKQNAVVETYEIGERSATQRVYGANEMICQDGRLASSSAPLAVGVKLCPLPTSMFTGRVDPLGVIGSYFDNKVQMRRVFVVHGLGGAGKTQTALKAVEQMAGRQVQEITC
jgi:hypothetical protein